MGSQTKLLHCLIVVLVAGVFLFAGCATGEVAAGNAAQEAKSFDVPAGMAVIHFYRSSLRGAYVLFRVELDEDTVGVVGSRQFLRRVVKPGDHTIILSTGSATTLPEKFTLTAMPGENYYVDITLEFASFSRNRMVHKMVAAQTAENDIREFQLVNWTD